jgi:hypothetical protein
MRSARMTFLPRVAVVLSVAAVAAPALAQETVPAPLVRALLGGPGGRPEEEARFTVGRLPDGVPAAAFPPGAEITGGVSSFRGTTAVAVVRGHDPASLYRVVGEQLRAAGWEPSRRAAFGNLFDAEAGRRTGGSDPYPTMFCRNGESLRIGYSPLPRSEWTLHVNMDRGPMAMMVTSCSERSTRQRFAGAPVTDMTAPAGMQLHGMHSGGGEDHFNSGADVETTLGVGELVEHYAAQLAARGWSVGERVAHERMASRVLQYRDERGRVWNAALVAVALPFGSGRQISLVVEQEGARRSPPLSRAP